MQTPTLCAVGRYYHERTHHNYPVVVVNYGHTTPHSGSDIAHWERLFLERRQIPSCAWYTVMSNQSVFAGPRRSIPFLPAGRTLDSIALEFHPELHFALRVTHEDDKGFAHGMNMTGGVWGCIIVGELRWLILADYIDGRILEREVLVNI